MKILENDLPLFPLHTVLFPQGRLPLYIFEPRYQQMIERCLKQDLALGVLLIKEGAEVGGPAVPHTIGTLARIVDVARLPENKMNIVVTGIARFRLLEQFNDQPYSTGRVELLPDENVNLAQVERETDRVAELFNKFVAILRNVTGVDEEEEQDTRPLNLPKDPTVLSYSIASSLPISTADKQALLEIPTTHARLRREIAILDRELQILELVTDKSKPIRDQGSFSLN